jgi:hypothetical protein
MLNGCVAVFAGEDESATCTVKEEFPACVGIPLIVPLAARVKPVGNVPEVMDQLYGAVPPVAVNVAE